MNEKTIISLSRDLNEPKWLLEERLKAFKTFTLLTKDNARFEALVANNSDYVTDFKGNAVRSDSIYDFLEDKNRKDMAKLLFQHRFFKPLHSPEAAFVNAFFNEVNFFGVENEKAKSGSITLAPKSGIALNFFLLSDRFSLKLDVAFNSKKPVAFASEFYASDDSQIVKTETIASPTVNPLVLNANLMSKNSKFESKSTISSGGFFENSTLFMGEGASLTEKSTLLLDGEQRAECKSFALHNYPGAKSDMSVRGVLRGNSFARVDALAKIGKAAKKSDSQVSAHLLLLDKGARAIANPDLEILNNDVVAGHSASVGEIDEDQVFYLMSRGIPEKEAKDEIVEGFLRD